jgi:hypothetical protein
MIYLLMIVQYFFLLALIEIGEGERETKDNLTWLLAAAAVTVLVLIIWKDG